MKSLKLAVFFACAVLTAACEDDPAGAGRSKLTLTADTTYIAVQETVQLTAAVGSAASSEAAYRSLNEGVATVDAAGLVTGRSVGVAGIVAERGRLADTVLIHITPAPRDALATGAMHACVLDVDGRAHCWGANGDGQLGNGSTAPSSAAPVAVVGGHTFAMVEAGDSTSCALTPSGDAYCWGVGTAGQLGNGTTQSSAVPVRVAAPQPLARISVGGDVVCAVGRDGTVYCWGRNIYGNVGNGTRVMATTPTQVSSPLRFSQVSVGFFQSCALTADGTAFCWGRNNLRTLGNDPAVDSETPVRVAGGLRFSTISAGAMTTCGIAVTGGTYCWGTNFYGSLGTGGQAATVWATPNRIVQPAEFTRVAAGEENNVTSPNCLLTGEGQAYCLGANADGQLGTAATTESCRLNTASPFFGCSSRPLPVLGAPNFETIDPGAEFVCALTHFGDVYCWGSNREMQLGAFTGPSSSTPVRVAANLRLP